MDPRDKSELDSKLTVKPDIELLKTNLRKILSAYDKYINILDKECLKELKKMGLSVELESFNGKSYFNVAGKKYYYDTLNELNNVSPLFQKTAAVAEMCQPFVNARDIIMEWYVEPGDHDSFRKHLETFKKSLEDVTVRQTIYTPRENNNLIKVSPANTNGGVFLTEMDNCSRALDYAYAETEDDLLQTFNLHIDTSIKNYIAFLTVKTKSIKTEDQEKIAHNTQKINVINNVDRDFNALLKNTQRGDTVGGIMDDATKMINKYKSRLLSHTSVFAKFKPTTTEADNFVKSLEFEVSTAKERAATLKLENRSNRFYDP